MENKGPRWYYQLAAGIVIGLIMSGLILFINARHLGEPITIVKPTVGTIYIQIDGAVNQPGVYSMDNNARVVDAISAAGWFTGEADPGMVNQAARLYDGMKLVIPTLVSAGTQKSAIIQAGKLDLNLATQSDLESLPEIGPAKAKAILEYRNLHGRFESIEELLLVPGIGASLFDKIKSLIWIP